MNAPTRIEACDPYAVEPPPVRLRGLLERLTRDELEYLALAFYGRRPANFEETLLKLWAFRRPA